jgi:hypothetical protein
LGMVKNEDLVQTLRFEKFASKANFKRGAKRRSPEGVRTARRLF